MIYCRQEWKNLYDYYQGVVSIKNVKDVKIEIDVEKFKEQMIMRGYTQKKLAKTIGMNRTSIYRVLSSRRNVSSEFIAKILYLFSDLKFEDIFRLRPMFPKVDEFEQKNHNEEEKKNEAG